MPWLKKNLWLVVGGLVAVVLLAVAAFYLLRSLGAEAQVTRELNDQTQELNTLANQNPHPGNEKVNNIEEAKKQERELETFLKEAQRQFVALSYPSNLEGGQFKLLLDGTIDDLQRRAERASVKLPAQYAFTFAAQKSMMSFDQNTIPALARALVDVRAITELLIEAKILTLDGIRRSPVTTTDTPGAMGQSDYWNKKAVTNDLAVLTPYEFTVHCFTKELAVALEKLYSSPHGFLVKNVVVDPSASQLLEKTATPETSPLLPMGGFNLAQLQMMLRYGMYGRRFLPQPEVTAPQALRSGTETVLDEKPFRTILWVDVLRLRDLSEVKAGRAAKPARSRMATPDGLLPADGTPAPDAAGATNAPATP